MIVSKHNDYTLLCYLVVYVMLSSTDVVRFKPGSPKSRGKLFIFYMSLSIYSLFVKLHININISI